jgi:hypothetical protein
MTSSKWVGLLLGVTSCWGSQPHWIISASDRVCSCHIYLPCSRQIAEHFRAQILLNKDITASPPVRTLGSCTFMFLRHADIYILCITRNNCNCMLAFKFCTSVSPLGFVPACACLSTLMMCPKSVCYGLAGDARSWWICSRTTLAGTSTRPAYATTLC